MKSRGRRRRRDFTVEKQRSRHLDCEPLVPKQGGKLPSDNPVTVLHEASSLFSPSEERERERERESYFPIALFSDSVD
jgi:hypothetical protein